MGLVHEVPEGVVNVSRDEFNLIFSDLNDTEKNELPIPATYVVDRTGTIVYACVKLDYSQRAEPSDVLDALVSLNSKEA